MREFFAKPANTKNVVAKFAIEGKCSFLMFSQHLFTSLTKPLL